MTKFKDLRNVPISVGDYVALGEVKSFYYPLSFAEVVGFEEDNILLLKDGSPKVIKLAKCLVGDRVLVLPDFYKEKV